MAEGREGTLEVVLTSISGERLAALRMEPTETVSRVKDILQEDFGYPPQSQQFLLQGDILQCDVSLEALPEPLSFTLVLLQFDKSEALYHAAERGHEAAVRSLLLKVACSSDETSDLLLAGSGIAYTALHCAAEHGHGAACGALLAAAPSQGVSSQMLLARFGWTALHYAAQRGHETVCHALLEAAPTVEVRLEMLAAGGGKSRTPLHRAASEGHEAACRALLRLAPAAEVQTEMLEARDQLGNTALQVASLRGHAAALGALLDFDRSLEDRHISMSDVGSPGMLEPPGACCPPDECS